MAAISANLLAAAAPSLTRLLNLTAQTATPTQPTVLTGFANFLTQATTTSTTTTATTADTVLETDSTDATATGADAAAAVLAAIGLIPQQLPTLPTPLASGPPSQTLAASIPLDPAVDPTVPTPDDTASRSVELQLSAIPLPTGGPDTNPILTVAAPTTTPAVEAPDLPEPTTEPAPTLQPGTPVAATPGEVVAAATRPPAVAPQTPLVVDRTQQLPAQLPEIGYGLVGPTVSGPPAVNPVPAVGATPSQAQVEQIAANLPPVEPTARPTPTDTTRPARPFGEVLAAESSAPAPDTTAPVSQVVTAAPPVTPQPVTNTPAEPTPSVSQSPAQKTPLDTPTAQAPLDPAPATAKETVPQSPRETRAVPDSVPVAAFAPTAPIAPVAPAVVETSDPVAAVESGQPQFAPPAPTSVPAEPAPVAAPKVAPNAAPVASQMCDAFVTHARVIEKGGTHEFQLRLDPPELGEVKVRVLAMGDRIEARLVVSDDAVKRLIESQLPELRQRLEAAGVSVPSFDVSTNGGGKRADTGGDGWDRSQPAFAPTRRPSGPPRLTPPNTTAPGGRLDVTA